MDVTPAATCNAVRKVMMKLNNHAEESGTTSNYYARYREKSTKTLNNSAKRSTTTNI